MGGFQLAGGGQFLDWGYSYTNAFLCEYLSVSTPIICAVCVCILYRIKHFSKNYVKTKQNKQALARHFKATGCSLSETTESGQERRERAGAERASRGGFTP